MLQINPIDLEIKHIPDPECRMGRITVGQRALYRCVTVSRSPATGRIKAVFKEITPEFLG